MNVERILRGVALLALVVLVVVLVTMTITALSNWWAIVIVLGLAVVGGAAANLLKRHVRRGTVLEIDLDRGLVETTGSDPIGRVMSRGSVTVRDFVEALERGAGDRRVAGLVVRLGNGGVDVAHAQELREAVRRFRDAGKKTVAFAEAFGENHAAIVDYYLAVAFSEIWLQPMGLTSIEGMVARSAFLRGVFDKLGLLPDFDHRKEYKAAKYRFTETEFTDPHREALEAVAGDRFSQIVEGIAADRHLDPGMVRDLVDAAPLTTEEALAAGLVDHIGYREEAYGSAGGTHVMFHDRYLKKAGRPHRKGKRIALVYGTGSITRGSPRFDPLTGGSSLGADEVAKAFRMAVASKAEAIVFRVDSPGGSAVASEVVSHEVARARAAGKPVVVSMGNVAGSGGYWVSAAADRIVAEPGTITGSIGVVWGKLANREAWARLGISFDQISFGQNATFASSQDPYTDSERDRLDVLIDNVYDRFVAGVASGRDLEATQVEEIAKGRIWTGAQAKERGLIDELGGLEKAIAIAKTLAGIDAEDAVRLVVFPRERTIPIPERKDNSDPVYVTAAALVDAMSGLRDSVSGLRAPMSGF